MPSSLRLLGTLIMGIMVTACQGSDAQVVHHVTAPVFQAARQDSYDTMHAYLGLVEARRTAALAFEVAGTVTLVDVDAGDAVAKGQRLAMLDTKTLQARLEELQALVDREEAVLQELVNGPRQEDIAAAKQDVEALRAQDDLASLTRSRSQALISRDVIAPQEWDEARLDKERLLAQRRQAEERLRELLAGTRQERIDAQRALVLGTKAQRDQIVILMEKSEIRAPWDGAVTARHADEGAVLDPGAPVLEIIETGWLEARIGLAGASAARLVPGKVVTLQAEAGPCNATVRALVPQRDARRRTVEAILDIHDPHHAPVRSGDIVRLPLPRNHQTPGFWLPLTALTESFRGLWACYVAMPDGEGDLATIETRQLEVLATRGEAAYVRGSLAQGERVVAAGLHKIAPGQRVLMQPMPQHLALGEDH